MDQLQNEMTDLQRQEFSDLLELMHKRCNAKDIIVIVTTHNSPQLQVVNSPVKLPTPIMQKLAKAIIETIGEEIGTYRGNVIVNAKKSEL